MFNRLKAQITVKFLVRFFLVTLAAGILTQIIGIFLLANSVRVQEGNIKSSRAILNAADIFLTASNFSPHFVIANTFLQDSKTIRLVKIADVSAQLLRQSNSIISDFSTSKDLSDFLRNKDGATQIKEASIAASPLLNTILNLANGSDGGESIDKVFGRAIGKPIRSLKAIDELGRNSEVLFGCGKESKFLILLTSTAEARSIGGLIGQYVTVVSNCGDLEIVRVGANTDLKDNEVLNKNFQQFPGLFQSDNPEWVNSNLIPDGFEVSRSWMRAYEEQFGETLDGVLALDTSLLSEFAAVKGGLVAADGTKLANSAEIDSYLRNGIYFQFPENQILRKQHLLEITEKLAESLDLSALTKSGMLPALFTALSEDRILFSLNSKLHTQEGLEHISWSSKERGTVFISVNNLSGSKFDFYSKYSVQVNKCSKIDYSIRFRVNNSASVSAQYPDYVSRRLDNYPLGQVGVLNQYLISYDKRAVRVTGEETPAFSDYRIMRGEANRDLISIVEFIEAQEKYEFSIRLKSNKNLNFRMWGQELKVSESKSSAC
jgi:hypothetical protein